NYTDFTSRFDTWKLNHTLVTSLEYAHETSLNYARTGAVTTTTLFDPNYHAPYPFEIRRTGAYAEAKADTLAVSLFDTIKLREQWQLTGGVRFDHFNLDYKSIAPSGVYTNGSPLSRTDNLFSYRAGVVYKPKPFGSIYAAYGTSFNPSGEGLSLATNTTAAAANFKTDPEESRTYEIGTKWDLLENRLALSLAIFRTEKDRTRTEDPTDPSDIVVLQGKQRVDGIELGAAGSVTKEWKVYGGFAHMIGEVVKSRDANEDGNEIQNLPENSFTLWTTYLLPWDIEIGGGTQFVDSRFNNNNRVTRREAPEYWLFDATAAWIPNKNFSLRLNVYNLAEKEYIDRVGGGHFIPGAGRSAVLTANLTF
ncbi:MAG TPA: TonB-dependent receptor, partial [Candidatus Acidoferrum sp.]|nr:TonB-dependent receptor [Candidatus Acidoferrum sp.]